MSFKKEKFFVIRKALDKDLASFLFTYLQLKKVALDYLQSTRYLSPYDYSWGRYSDPQAANTYSIYGDMAMETLLFKLKDKVEKYSGLKLVETYSYARLYKKGDVLARHIDRKSCAVSGTMFLGGDEWPIYINPTNKLAQSGIKINLKVGDLLLYSGDAQEHWREEFEGEMSGQVFLHYNKINSDNKYDTRPLLGLPSDFRKEGDYVANT
jgi:hypothetical protein